MKVAGWPASIFARSRAKGLRGQENAVPVELKNVHAHVIGIGPDSEVRVVEKVRAEVKAVTVCKLPVASLVVDTAIHSSVWKLTRLRTG